jgi:hypothetical protein
LQTQTLIVWKELMEEMKIKLQQSMSIWESLQYDVNAEAT